MVISQLFREISYDRGQILGLQTYNSPVEVFKLKGLLKLPNSEGSKWKMFSRQNTLVPPLLIKWIVISMSQKSLPKQLLKTRGFLRRNLAFAPRNTNRGSCIQNFGSA